MSRAPLSPNASSWALAAPALALLLIGSIGPLLIVVVYSFLSPGDYSGVQRPFTLTAWEQVFLTRDIFDDSYSWADAHLTIFWRSVKLSVATTVITFLLGLPTAWFIATRPPHRRALWLFLITIPFWTNLLIRTIAINEIIRSEGLLNQVLRWFGAGPVNLLYTDAAVLVGMAYVYLPMMVLPMYAAIDRFDMRLLEAAYDLAASRWKALIHVVLPVIRPGIVAGSILVFVPSLGAYVTPRVLAVFVLLYLPIVTLVAYSFNGGASVAVWGGFSLDWYGRAWANETVKAAAIRSLVIAGCASAIATVLATLAATGIVRNRGMRGRGLAYMAINQPLMVPEIVTATALLIFFAAIRKATGYQGLGYLIAAHAAFCIPFAYLPIAARLAGRDATLEAAAADLYASPARAFRHVTLPLLMPGIAAGAMLAFVISLDDVVITEFVKSAGQDTLPTYMLGQMRRGVSPEVNAISTMLLAVTVLLLTAFFILNRSADRGKA